MFPVDPAFFSSGDLNEGLLTPGTPTPSAIAVSGTPTQILYCYVVSSTFLLGAGTCGVG